MNATLRRLLLGAAALALAAAAPLAALGAPGPSPRDQVTVHGPEIRLGHLFLNLDGKADAVVATAPSPGGRTLIDAARLGEIAAEHGLDWKPTGRERVAVERGSRTLDAEGMARRLAEAIRAQSPDRQYEVDLESRSQSVQLPTGSDAEVTVEGLRVDERERRVAATLVLPDGHGGSNKLAVAGRLFPVIDVPVLRDPVMPGQAIREDQVDWIKLRADRARRGMLTEARQIVGMTPRRPVMPGAPLDLRDLQERIVVSKGASVTVVFRTPQMMLTTVGRSLEDAATGGAVRILNTQSNRPIEAVVTGPDMVEVRAGALLAQSLGRK